MTYTKSNIVQYNEYYPFGLQTSNSWTRENASNNFLYNGGSELNDNSGWYETFFRGYDAALGRFMQVDPLASSFSSLSPYHFAYNQPVLFNDPNGDEGDDPTDPYSGRRSRSGPGSGNHWSDEYRSVYGNYMLMSTSTFRDFYGLNDGYGGTSYERAGEVARALVQGGGSNYGVTVEPRNGTEAISFLGDLMYEVTKGGVDDFLKKNVWCPYCGEFAFTGVDGKDYYYGGWIPAGMDLGRGFGREVFAQDGNLRLHSTLPYISDGSKSGDFNFQGGMHVRIVLTNMNYLGVQYALQDQTRYYLEKTWLGLERKVYDRPHSGVILPLQSQSFDFYRFDYSPIEWKFGLGSISDAVNIRITIYSTWIPGDPVDMR